MYLWCEEPVWSKHEELTQAWCEFLTVSVYLVSENAVLNFFGMVLTWPVVYNSWSTSSFSGFSWISSVRCHEVLCWSFDSELEAGDGRKWSEGHVHSTRYDHNSEELWQSQRFASLGEILNLVERNGSIKQQLVRTREHHERAIKTQSETSKRPGE